MDNYVKEFEEFYQQSCEAPWTFRKPPKELVYLIESGVIKKGKVLDIGCGEGFYDIYLASKGFQVTGADQSKNAINHAKKHAKEATDLSCNFLVLDHKNINTLKDKFDFILDWRFLHEIIEINERKDYVADVYNLLKQGGKYLSVSLSVESELFGKGKIRKAGKGVLLYFASQEELTKLFEKYFKIIEKKTILVSEKGHGNFPANYFFMEKS